MKKLVLTLSILGLLVTSVSCEPETDKDQLADEFAIDKDKNCPPSDRNCNGIPDSQEQ